MPRSCHASTTPSGSSGSVTMKQAPRCARPAAIARRPPPGPWRRARPGPVPARRCRSGSIGLGVRAGRTLRSSGTSATSVTTTPGSNNRAAFSSSDARRREERTRARRRATSGTTSVTNPSWVPRHARGRRAGRPAAGGPRRPAARELAQPRRDVSATRRSPREPVGRATYSGRRSSGPHRPQVRDRLEGRRAEVVDQQQERVRGVGVGAGPALVQEPRDPLVVPVHREEGADDDRDRHDHDPRPARELRERDDHQDDAGGAARRSR